MPRKPEVSAGLKGPRGPNADFTFTFYRGTGNNISLDLKKEQQNKVLKKLWGALAANINENNGARGARALEALESIMDLVNVDCNYSSRVCKSFEESM